MPNGAALSISYDGAGRPRTSTSPFGAQTTYAYTNLPRTVTATINGRWTKTTYDGLGREVKVEAGDGAGTKSVVDTEYGPCACSPVGKVSRVSQPYAAGGTVYWTTYGYDGLGRVASIAHAGNSGATTYVYEGNTVKVTDPAGKWKKYTLDALGNLVQVTEPNPAGGAEYQTYYAYNLRGQLTTVTMPRGGATQTRTFNYELSTGRLLSATNPENGTVSYTWNADGTLLRKTDAKGQKIEYSYDGYKRVTQVRRYKASGTEETCQRADLYYDSNPLEDSYSQNAWGRLTAAQWGGTGCTGGEWAEMYSYTVAGRATKKRLVRGESPYLEASWTWDNEGRMVSVTYPNGGAKYTYTYDTMGRPVKLTDNQATPKDWVKDVVHNAAGQMTAMSYYMPSTHWYIDETREYNGRGQLTRIQSSFINQEYFYPAGNNGRIERMKDWKGGEEVSYQYDSLNRLISAVTTGPEWGQSFEYDGFGNLLSQVVTKGSAPTLYVNVNAATNRITTSGYTYDANGNLTKMPLIASLVYDVENRLIEATHSSRGTDYYQYDPWNRRVWKDSPSGPEETYFYGVDGKKLGTYGGGSSSFSTRSENVWFAGRPIRMEDSPAEPDRVGSLMRGYYPYGEERTTSGHRTKFATYYRDDIARLCGEPLLRKDDREVLDGGPVYGTASSR